MTPLSIALLGLPNAGKSTLANRMAERKFSIVTHKAQTTRSLVRGVASHHARRLFLLDMPGFSPAMREAASPLRALGMVEEADLLLLVVDAARKTFPDRAALEKALSASEKPIIIALNKIDRLQKSDLLALAESWAPLLASAEGQSALFMISAKKGDGVEDLLSHIGAMHGKSEDAHLQDADFQEMPPAAFAAEITREKCYLRLHEEIPYQLEIEPSAWKKKPDGSLEIQQILWVARKQHKKVAIGKDGSALRAIGEAARREMEEVFSHRVHLRLFVKVKARGG